MMDTTSKPQTEADRWQHRMAAAYGGTARRRVRRAFERSKAKKVVIANRRRVRQFLANQRAAGTLRQQVRVYDGEIGTPAQRELMQRHFSAQSKLLGLPVEAVVTELRDAIAAAV